MRSLPVVLVIGCGGSSGPPAFEGLDPGPVPSDVAEEEEVQQSACIPQLIALVGVDGASSGEGLFEPVVPGSGLTSVVQVALRNPGACDVVITSIELKANNGDGSWLNPWVTLDFGGDLPHAIVPKQLDSALLFNVVYAPGVCLTEECGYENAATLAIGAEHLAKPLELYFTKPDCVDDAAVVPPVTVFASATPVKAEVQDFEIVNEGMCRNTIKELRFTTSTKVFELEKDWDDGTILHASFEPDYAPLAFRVRYTPTSGDCADEAVVQVVREGAAPIEVPVSGKCEGASLDVSHDCPKILGGINFLNVGATKTKACTVLVVNDGPADATITSVSVPWDPDATHYEVSTDPLPVALVAGESTEIGVVYHGSDGYGLGGRLVIAYESSAIPARVELPMYGGSPKGCFDFGPGKASAPILLQFVGSKGEAVPRQYAVYNCGSEQIWINDLRLEDAGAPGEPSEHYAISGGAGPPIQIPAGTMWKGEVTMQVDGSAAAADGTLFIDHDGHNMVPSTMGVPLQGRIDPIANAPTAVIETSGAATLGKAHVLSAVASTPGSEVIAPNGYAWMLLAKPSGSGVILNGLPAGPWLTWYPDEPGAFEIGLLIVAGGDDSLFSELATVTVEVPKP